MFKSIQNSGVYKKLKENSFQILIWLLNFLPNIGGFPLSSNKINVNFWILHGALSAYVYIVGVCVYQMYYVKGIMDSINSFFNASIFILIVNASTWILTKRTNLKVVLEMAKKNDDMIQKSGRFQDKYKQMLKRVKMIVIGCYIFNLVNDLLIYVPSRTLEMDKYSTANCVGLDIHGVRFHRYLCMATLAFQELVAVVVVATYDVIMLFLLSHTTAVFHILAEDMNSLNNLPIEGLSEAETSTIIRYRLKNVASRHILILQTIEQLQDLYGVIIGLGFGLDAISLCLFFILPLDVCLNFIPLVCYTLFVFFLYCYQGQRLTNSSEKFEMAVYCCGWEKFGLKEQKFVLFMLKRSQKPVALLAAYLIPIRMYTFANTMQSIYKFVTVFKM